MEGRIDGLAIVAFLRFAGSLMSEWINGYVYGRVQELVGDGVNR